EPIESLPTAAHAYEFGSAVNRPPVVVRYGPLRPVIADPEAADRNLPNAERPDLAQVLFEHQSVRGHFVSSDLFQNGIEFVQRCNHRLIFSRRTERFLQTDRSAREHASRCPLGIAVAEYGVARQHALPHALGESRGPAQWSLRVTNDEAMGDGFRLDEKIGDNAAVEIIRRTNPET